VQTYVQKRHQHNDRQGQLGGEAMLDRNQRQGEDGEDRR
jgi:hypothetical protein